MKVERGCGEGVKGLLGKDCSRHGGGGSKSALSLEGDPPRVVTTNRKKASGVNDHTSASFRGCLRRRWRKPLEGGA